MVSAAESDDVDGGPFWAKPGFILAALALAAVALLGVVLAFRANGGEDEPVAEPPAATESATAADPAQTSDSAAPTSSPTAAPDPGSNCPALSGRGGEDAISTAPDVQWSPVGEVAAALSDDNGPARRDGVKECFAQTPEGALLAAYNFLADVRTSTSDPTEVVTARVSKQAAGYGQLLADSQAERNLTSMTVQGYRFLATDNARYTVSLVSSLPGTADALFLRDEVLVEWNGSDWHVMSVLEPEQVDGLPGDYVRWSPAAEDLE